MNTFLKRNAGLICSIAASLGVAATAMLSGHYAIKAHNDLSGTLKAGESIKDIPKKEIAKKTWKTLLPPAISGATTIGLIFLAHSIGVHQQAVLAATCGGIASVFHEYQKKVIELYGEDAHEYVVRELKAEHAESVDISYESAFYRYTDSPDPLEHTYTFFEPISGKLFESSTAQVISAWLHLNRNFALRGKASVVEYFEFLGISDMISVDDAREIAAQYDADSVNMLGWTAEEELYFIDFSRTKKMFAGDVEVVCLDPLWSPINLVEYDPYAR